MGDRVEVAFPPEWTPAGPPFDAPPLESAVTELWNDAGACCGALFALRFDGVRLCSLSWPGGARFARTRAATSWATEERYQGKVPPDLKGSIDRAWRNALGLLAAAAKQSRLEEVSE